MRGLTRRGVTLVELMVAVSLSSALALFLLSETGRQQRVVQEVAVRVSSFSSLETAAQVIRSELGGAEPGDLVSAAPDRIVYRATRATGTVCGPSPDGIRLSQADFRGLRVPVAGRDSVMLTAWDSVSAWRVDRRAITGPTRAEPCPDGSQGLVVPSPPSVAIPGVPLRVFEVMELRLYASGGGWWMGARSLSSGETIQPVAGPFAPDGIVFQLLDVDGQVTGDAALARLIQVRLKVEAGDHTAAAGAIRSGSRMDSLTVMIRLGAGGS